MWAEGLPLPPVINWDDMSSQPLPASKAIPLGTWAGIRIGLHPTWIPLLAVLAGTARAAGAGWGTAIAGALAGAGAHAAVAAALLHRRAVKPDEWVVSPYGALPRAGRRPMPMPAGGWIPLVIAGILVRLVCALLCRTLMPEGVPSATGADASWAVLYRWNLLLAWLHPLPAIPLDGSRALRSWAGMLLPPSLTAAILRRTGRVCAVVLLVWSLMGDLNAPALLTALFLWHAAETAARPEGAAMPGASSDAEWNPDEIVVSPPPYARRPSGTAPGRPPFRSIVFGRIQPYLAQLWRE